MSRHPRTLRQCPRASMNATLAPAARAVLPGNLYKCNSIRYGRQSCFNCNDLAICPDLPLRKKAWDGPKYACSAKEGRLSSTGQRAALRDDLASRSFYCTTTASRAALLGNLTNEIENFFSDPDRHSRKPDMNIGIRKPLNCCKPPVQHSPIKQLGSSGSTIPRRRLGLSPSMVLMSPFEPSNPRNAEATDTDHSKESSTKNPISKTDTSGTTSSEKTYHMPLSFQSSSEALTDAMQSGPDSSKRFWRYSMYTGPQGQKVKVHYCRKKDASERIAQDFLDKTILGFDLEWRPNATSNHGIKSNVSLIQLASEDKIALFHIALHNGETVEQLLPPTLQRIMEDPDILKIGVGIKADCTRLKRFLGVESRGLFELSHLYKVVKASTTGVFPDKRLVSFSTQMQEIIGLPLFKGAVRGSDWARELNMEQIVYAASDAYAAVQLYDTMEAMRKALKPTPPRPHLAERNLPIQLTDTKTILSDDSNEDDDDLGAESPEEQGGEELQKSASASESFGAAIQYSDESDSESSFQSNSEDGSEDDGESESDSAKGSANTQHTSGSGLNLSHSERRALREGIRERRPVKIQPRLSMGNISLARRWVWAWHRALPRSYRPQATTKSLIAYALWYNYSLDPEAISESFERPRPRSMTTACYIMDAITQEDLPYDGQRVLELARSIKSRAVRAKYRKLLEPLVE